MNNDFDNMCYRNCVLGICVSNLNLATFAHLNSRDPYLAPWVMLSKFHLGTKFEVPSFPVAEILRGPKEMDKGGHMTFISHPLQ